MNPLPPKQYQADLLASVERYFRAIHEDLEKDAEMAFLRVTKELWGQRCSYKPIAGFEKGMPYFCLRVPTGGGKTLIGGRCVPLVNRYLLQTEHSIILWLVPSNAIREQTWKAFCNRAHPYHAALAEAGALTVLNLEEAKALTRATLDTSTVVIVATKQAFSQQEMDKLKVYESSGALQHHFGDITPEQRTNLLTGPENTAPYSFANVLRLRRPFVVVDEAHNARTELSFETLARFRPSGILELTATPDLEKTPSNVLHSVSAAELKAEAMIKLPILLETEPDWQKALAYAIDKRNQLQTLADREHLGGAPYLRPLVLIQSQPRRQNVETLHAEALKAELIRNHNIPAEEIAIATGEQRDLEDVNVFAPDCRIKYIITQQALAEGWDCSFAYVLASVAELRSEMRVEQLLGRILRQPGAVWRKAPELNRSYAFVASRDFGATANALRDRLVEGAGFDKKDAAEFVAAGNATQAQFDLAGSRRVELRPVVVQLTEKPDLTKLDAGLRGKVKWDSKNKTLTISKPIAPEEDAAIAQTVVWQESQKALTEAALKSRTEAVEVFKTPSERSVAFRVPQLAVRVHGELQLFDDPEALDYPWDLPVYASQPSPDEIQQFKSADRMAETGAIDVDKEKGKVRVTFLPELERDLALSYTPEHWTEAKLGAWLCRNVRETYITQQSMMVFVSAFLSALLKAPGLDLARANRQKFLLRAILEAKIRDLRSEAAGIAYQQFLFSDGVKDRATVGNGFDFIFHPDGYAPSRDYARARELMKHYYPRVGDFDGVEGGEEEQCAYWLDRAAQRGEIEFWVRNLVRKPTCSFFLPTATDRFYPDFVCQLPGGKILVVEYKGADRWTDAEPSRKIGELWEELSGGKCLFVMVKDKRWDWIEAKLRASRSGVG
ncbi:MAG: DEAD/DEAH box helicase family protein [Verrucomicrobia bacterium]|nr:DEAD/DEAH box helicase family protein [Verrucomicrobiota bacterium]